MLLWSGSFIKIYSKKDELLTQVNQAIQPFLMLKNS
ncbi:MAG: hypothetical protein RLZZ612_79 [Pseudomonadota bacterium]|jgi:hypothetical protein